MIFDTDVFTTKDLSPEPAQLLPRFEALRAMKNRLFFGAVTEQTLKLFE
jgi:uncharacterized protein (TIGR04255 family)